MKKSPKQRSTLKDRVRRIFKTNKLCQIAFEELENDVEVQTMLEDSNRMAIDRMGYSDHGHTHSLIVTMNGVRLFRQLLKGVQPTIVQEETGDAQDAELVVMLGCYLHDIGMVVGRTNHDEFSVVLALPIIDRILAKVYPKDRHKQVHIRNHILHAIYCHDRVAMPLTVEAGVVGIADALDMTKGRARIPFEAGKVDIHSVSALSIKKIEVEENEEKPISIKITMSNSAGIFQIDELLKPRIENSGLKEYIHVVAEITGERERRIIKKFEI